MAYERQEAQVGSNFKLKLPAGLDVPRIAFLLCAVLAISTIIFIVVFIFYTAMPTFQREGISFITGTDWDYNSNQYGVWIFLGGTIWLTATTIAIACPFGILSAIYLAEYSPKWVANILRPMIELLVGIPSVVYGIFGLYIMADYFRDYINPFISGILGFIPIFQNLVPTKGYGVFLASTVLSIMILPTITSLSIEAIRAVPVEYKEASVAIGATKWETTKKVVLPVASSGIIMAMILGIMRAMGETMAVVMLLGGQMQIPGSIFDLGYAMTSKILNDISYWIIDPDATSALFGIAAVLLIMEIIMVAAARWIGGRKWN